MNRSKELPTLQLSPSTTFAYRTGLPQERFGHIVHTLADNDELAKKLLRAAEPDQADIPELLAEFVVQIVLTIPELDWPVAQPPAVVKAWLDGVEMSDVRGQAAFGVRALTIQGPRLTKAALVALVIDAGEDPVVANTLALRLGIRRLETGTPSMLAHAAVGRTYPGERTIERLEASRCWREYHQITNLPTLEGFRQFIDARVASSNDHEARMAD